MRSLVAAASLFFTDTISFIFFFFFSVGKKPPLLSFAQVFHNPLSAARPRDTLGTRAFNKNGFIYSMLQNYSLLVSLKSQRPHLRPGMDSLPLA